MVEINLRLMMGLGGGGTIEAAHFTWEPRMHKLLSLVLAAVAPSVATATIFILFAPAAGAIVTWNFVVSSCTVTEFGVPCSALDGATIATMVIDQPTGSGTAIWGSPITSPQFPNPPVITGDSNFNLEFIFTGISIDDGGIMPKCFFNARVFMI